LSNIEITRWPVLLYANYRTGSNLLGKNLAKLCNAAWHNEPVRSTQRLEEFLKSYYSQEKYIVKAMPDQIELIKETHDLLSSDCFKIRLLRKNEFEQVVSYYIALISDKWVQTDAVVSEYNIPLDYETLNKAISIIKTNNRLLENSTIKFDLTLYYEDLDFENDLLYKITPPTNIDILKKIIKRVYEQR
jgi:hypothetical protein